MQEDQPCPKCGELKCDICGYHAGQESTGKDVLASLPKNLVNENGGGFGFVMIWQGDNEHQWTRTVGAFLSMPENQFGTWLIDGGWGGPPGPIHVRWNGDSWESGGYCGVEFKKPGKYV